MNLNLQELIDKTEEYGTLALEFNEYFGQAVIDKPLIIEGNHSTVCAKQGPVIHISSENVEIRNLRIEVTCPSDAADEKGFLALCVQEFLRVRLHNVVVKGNVSGIVLEDGVWEYPESLHIWPVVPGRKNSFVFEMKVPVSCSLETDIAGLRILTPGLRNPGFQKIQLEVNDLKKDTVLFGQIEIKSNYLRRIIAVSGGSFRAEEEHAESNEEHPIFLGAGLQPSEDEKIQKPETDLREKEKKGRNLLFAVFFLATAVIAGLTYWLILKKPAEDTVKPSGKIHLTQKVWEQGDTVSCRVTAEDNQQIETMEFRVQETDIRTVWNPRKSSADFEDSFSTQGWKPDSYTCVLLVTDSAGNPSEEYKESFDLEKKEAGEAEPEKDKPPYGEIAELKSEYEQGDNVTVTLLGNDDRDLKKIRFEVKNTFTDRSWDVSGTHAERKFSFSTKDWKPGTYTAVLHLADADGKKAEVTKDFLLKKEDREKPQVSVKDLKDSYQQGDQIEFTLQSSDNVSLKQIRFSVDNTVKESWNTDGKSFTRQYAFSAKDMKPGEYIWKIQAEDRAENTGEFSGKFRIAESTKPSVEIAELKKQGDTVSYKLIVKDDTSLKKAVFAVRGTSVKQSWHVTGQSAVQEDSFSTQNWKPGIYTCVLTAEDADGNQTEITKDFEVEGDTTKPSGKISMKRDKYAQGDTVEYEITAKDDKALKHIAFEVKNTDIRFSADTSDADFRRSSSFSTKNLKSGTYTCVLTAEDAAGNHAEITLDFKVQAVPPPSFEGLVKELTDTGTWNSADFLQLRISKTDVKIGDIISFHFRSEKDCYVNIVYLTADGELLQLFPNSIMRKSSVKAKQAYEIPGKDAPIELEVTGPAGTEKVIALVSEKPFSIFEASFESGYLFAVDKKNGRMIRKIFENIQKAKEQKIWQKQIVYSIRK